MKRAASKLLVACAALGIALFGVELTLRSRGYDPRRRALEGRVPLVRPSSYPGRGYELVPNARGEGWGTRVEINAHGFRGPEVELAVAGRTRIVALGDSITFGNDLAYEQTWPARLEAELAAAGAAVDVLNLGLGGYDTQQEVATLEHLGLAFRPARVVLAYCVNDVGVVSMSMETAFTEEQRDDLRFVSRLAQAWHVQRTEARQRRSLFERNREEAYLAAFRAEIDPLDPGMLERVTALRTAVASAPAADQDLATRRIPPRWYASEGRIGRLQHAFSRLAALAGQHGFEVTLLLVPYLEEEPLIEQGLELVAALARAQGFGVVTADEACRGVGLADLRIRSEDPVHPNARGHELLARAVATALVASEEP